jgi:uncharacterized protein (DUF433 family)
MQSLTWCEERERETFTNGLHTMQIEDRIALDSNVCFARPLIRGTRVPVTVVVGSLVGGMTFEEIQREYDLPLEDIRAALKFVLELAQP